MGCSASAPASTVAPSPVTSLKASGPQSDDDVRHSQLQDKISALKSSLAQQGEMLKIEEEKYSRASLQFDAMQALKSHAEEQLTWDAKEGKNRLARERIEKANEECCACCYPGALFPLLSLNYLTLFLPCLFSFELLFPGSSAG